LVLNWAKGIKNLYYFKKKVSVADVIKYSKINPILCG